MEMTLAMTDINDIKKLYFKKGLNVAEIMRKTGHDRKTINKYLDMNDFNLVLETPERSKRGSKLDPFKKTIDKWLEADKKVWRKQRHTAKRVHTRLTELYGSKYDCSYRLLAEYVRIKKKEIFSDEPKFFLPLKHLPGEAQVDFGRTDFRENGTFYEGHHLNLSFPQSNTGYSQLFKGENLQCLEQGMINIFNHLGGVPTRIVFDNASSMVSDIGKNKYRKLTEHFMMFKNHFRFEAVFCNPASGHEKGNIEGKVGYHRRNYFVPPPEFDNLDEFNKSLLTELDDDQYREHYRKNATQHELFQADLKALLPLPEVEFEPALVISKKTDANACITIHKGKHRYSTRPSLAKSNVFVKLTADKVIILDQNLNEVVTHNRLYGDLKQESINWILYLGQISKRPTALKYTGIYDLFPQAAKDYFDTLDYENLKATLKTLNTLTEETNFEAAVDALLDAISHGASDTDSIQVLFKRKNSKIMELDGHLAAKNAPELPELKPDIRFYDTFYTVADGVEAND